MGKGNFLTFLKIFVLIVLILFLFNLSLSPVLHYGFTPDDWGLLSFYKTLGDDPLPKIAYVWSVKGAYTTSQVYFIGILNDFFDLNYEFYQRFNIFLKTLATLALYPLVLVVFKRKLLAFLTTILYGLSYMGSRSLEYVVKGTDYLAIIPMNLFLIVYYYIVRERLTKLRWFFLMSFFWFISFMISPIRIYPILVLIPLIELFLWLQSRSRKNALNSLKRLLILYFPFLLVYLYNPNSILGFLKNPPVILGAVLAGNWHLALTPFQGVGLTVFFTEYWHRFFGVVGIKSLNDYLLFLLGGPLFIFGLLAAFLSIVKFKKYLKTFLTVFFLCTIFFIGTFFMATHLYGKDGMNFDPNRIYPSLIGGFLLIISIASFLEWRVLGKKDNLLLALWISPLITLLYTFLIWIAAPFGMGFEGQQGYYLVVPAILSSLFLATILAIIYEKILSLKNRLFQIITILIFFIFSIFTFLTNTSNTYYYFVSAGTDGRYASDQEKLYTQVLKYLGSDFNSNEPALLYFDVSEAGRSSYYYEESLFSNLPARLLIRDEKLNNGCIGTFYRGIDSLAKLIIVNSNMRGFVYSGQCLKENSIGNTIGIFYKPANFYAFKIKDGKFINITPGVLEKLGF